MYCDDMFIASSRLHWKDVRHIAVGVLTDLFGKDSHAKDKSDSTE
jgi:hypothetical protein